MVSFGGIARKLFGSSNDRRVRSYQPNVTAINSIEEKTKALTDEQLAAKTVEFRALLAEGKTLDDILIPAFAVVREASRRVLGLRPFDVQLVGGMILHSKCDRRDEDRRRQDPRRHPAGLSERAFRQGRARRHRQRLPRPARCRDHGPRLRLPRHDHRRHRPRPFRRGTPRGLCLRHHLRHQQRTRLRLSAR